LKEFEKEDNLVVTDELEMGRVKLEIELVFFGGGDPASFRNRRSIEFA
jgi:hypothetical protein